MGGKNIAIIPGTGAQPAKNGDTLQALKMPGMFDLVNDKITPLQNKLDRILTSTDTLLLGINHVLNPQTQEHLNKTIADLSATVHQFKATSYKLNGLLNKNQTHLNNSLKNFDKISQNLVVLSDSLKVIKIGKLTKDIRQSIAKLNHSLDKLNHGDGTVAKLMNDKKLYENLARSTKELELLLKDLREHPKRYVHFSIWGRKEKK